MAEKKFLSLDGLKDYDSLIKVEIAEGNEASLESAKSYTNTEIAKITNGTTTVPKATHSTTADIATSLAESRTISLTGDATGSVSFTGTADASITVTVVDDSHNHVISNIDGLQDALNNIASSEHNHDDRYYTETEIDTKISGVNSTISTHTGNSDIHVTTSNKTNWNAAYSHSTSAHAPSNAERNIIVGIQKNGTDLTVNSSTRKVDITVPTKASDIGAATSDHKHDDAYDAKGAADTALASAKEYTNTKTSGMATTTVVDNKISAHNTSTTAHNDIRDLVSALTTKVNNFLDVDDATTDQLSEVLELIEANKGTLESLTSSKVNVSDIVNNLTTSSTTKVLSANQGVVIKGLIDALQSEVDGKADETHSHTIAQVTNLQSTLNAKASQSDLDALEGVVNGKADEGHVHTIANITGLQTALDEKDAAIEAAKTEAANQDVVVLLEAQESAKTYTDTVAAGKADTDHDHAIADVTGLQDALDGKAASSHGTHVTWSTTSPKMNGTAAVGSETKVARGDHVHPTDTSRASKTEFDTHASDTTKHITSTERTNWGTAYTHSQAAHAPSNAEKNQNAFSNVKVGDTTIAADTTTDTLTLVGSNVTITPDATNDKITIEVATGSTSTAGILKLTNSTSSTSTTTAATPKSVKDAYDLANTANTAAGNAQTTADGKADKSHNHTVANITDLTATATELNYMDGVTSNVQTQLNGKAASGHGHDVATTSAAGFMSAEMVTKLNGIATGANKITVDSSLSTTSTNPVQNKIVTGAINDAVSAISANTSSITAHSTAISNLQTAIEEIKEITSAEIQALFA